MKPIIWAIADKLLKLRGMIDMSRFQCWSSLRASYIAKLYKFFVIGIGI